MGSIHLNNIKNTLHAYAKNQSHPLERFDLAPYIDKRKQKAVCEKVKVDEASNDCHHREDVDEQIPKVSNIFSLEYVAFSRYKAEVSEIRLNDEVEIHEPQEQ